MDENKSSQSGTATTGTTGDPGNRGGDGSEARETMIEGSKPIMERSPGDADTGREPEFYGNEDDPS